MRALILLGILSLATIQPAQAQTTSALLARIKSVGKEGSGNAEATKAWKELVGQGTDVAIDILAAFDGASPVAANYLRSAFETISERTLKTGKPLPAGRLESFVRDTKQNGPARRLAYEWLVKVDPQAEHRLLPDMINDPGAELRRDAVARLAREAQQALDKENQKVATVLFSKALKYARDRDQVQEIAGKLKKLGSEVDLTKHFGFITQWMIAGPFDNTESKGFHVAYPPEKVVDLSASYEGKNKKPIRWMPHTTTEPMGLVDFNKAIEHTKGVIAYGFSAVKSASEQPVELRAVSNNAIRIFLNGKEVYFREEYHHGTRMDQHVGKGILKAGRNEILVKVCQNEQTDTWADLWSFQLRVCDALGAAVPITIEGKN